MNANVMKTNTGKLLVAVLAIFVVVAGCAVILSDNGINAATTPDGTPEYPGNNGDFSTGTNYKLTTPITIGNGETVDLNGSTLYTEGNLITINGGTLKNGTVVDNNTKFGAISINNGTISGITLSDSRNGIYWSDDSVTPGDVTIENCTFTGTGLVSAIYYCVFPNNTNTVNISGCTFNGEYREGAINIEMSRQGITDSTKVVVSGTNPVSVNVWAVDSHINVGTGQTLDTTDATVSTFNVSSKTTSSTVNIIGDFVADEITGSGNIIVSQGGSITANHSDITPTGDTSNVDIDNMPELGSQKMPLSSNSIGGNDRPEISGEAYVGGETLTISEGKTLVIMSGGSLNMNDKNMVIEGTVIIEDGATVSNGGTITLMRGCTFDNSGIIGVDGEVDIVAGSGTNYDGVGKVTVANVSGMSFGFANTTSANAQKSEYTLTVEGNLYAEGTTGNTVTIDKARILGEFYIGQDVEVTITDATLRNGVTVTVDGTFNANGKLTMYNGSRIVVNGEMNGEVNAVAGDYKSSEREDSLITSGSINTFAIESDNPAQYSVGGYTLSVDSYTFQKENASGNNESWTAQRLYIEGTIAYTLDYSAISSGATITYGNEITITNDITDVGPVVAEGITVALPNGTKITNPGAPITIEGMIQITYTGGALDDFEYVGASYTVTVTGSNPSSNGYYTTFDAAMGAIETADRQTVTVQGDLEINAEYTVASGQTLVLPSDPTSSTAEDNADIVIGENGSLTIEQRATLNGNVDNVIGVMTVYTPSSFRAGAPDQFATKTEGTTAEGVKYTQYAGIIYAINNSNPGDNISVVGPAYVDGNLTIPAEVTVTVMDPEGSLTVTGNLTIEQTGSLVVTDNKTVSMSGDKSKVAVNGTLDLTEGTIGFTSVAAETDTAITSTTGTTIMTQTNYGTSNVDAINAVMYQNEDGLYVMTSAEAAIEAATAQDVNKYVVVSGNVTSGDLNLTVNMGIRTDANATFGTITVAEGCNIVVDFNGKLTATITAQTGVEGSESASSLTLASVSGIVVGETDVVDDQNVTTHQLYIAGDSTKPVAGAVTITEGTVVVGANVTDISGLQLNLKGVCFNKATGYSNSVLTVNDGATLEVNDDMTLAVGSTGTNNTDPAAVIDGTLTISKDGSVNVNGVMDVNGTMTVASENTSGVTVDGTLNVTGVLDISIVDGEESAITVSGKLIVGEKITTMGGTTAGSVTGAVNFGTSSGNTVGTVKVYNGASVEEAIIGGDADADGVSDAEHTAFYINGNLYMTIYAGTTTTSIDLSSEDFDLVGYDMKVMNGTEIIYDISSINYWYTDADMTKKVEGSANVGNPEALYFKVNASNVDVRVSVGQGISLYIDNIRYNSGETVSLSVGTHTVSASINPGFTGDVSVQFNGQTVNGSFTITPEMASNTYEGTLTITATGNITQDSTVVIDGGNTGSEMGLTDYLLIVLVILIVIMAIIVAMRLMRS